jgi:hypothetical protein
MQTRCSHCRKSIEVDTDWESLRCPNCDRTTRRPQTQQDRGELPPPTSEMTVDGVSGGAASNLCEGRVAVVGMDVDLLQLLPVVGQDRRPFSL